MYIDGHTIVFAGAILSAIVAFVTLFWKLFKWINHQKEQDEEIRLLKTMHKQDIRELKDRHEQDIKNLREKHEKDNVTMQEEQTIVIYGLLSCLKGLAEQGCDGPVSEAIEKIEKHINKKAHQQ